MVHTESTVEDQWSEAQCATVFRNSLYLLVSIKTIYSVIKIQCSHMLYII